MINNSMNHDERYCDCESVLMRVSYFSVSLDINLILLCAGQNLMGTNHNELTLLTKSAKITFDFFCRFIVWFFIFHHVLNIL